MRTIVHDIVKVGWPEGWMDLSTVILVGPPDGDFSPSITITRERLGDPIGASEYAEQQLPLLQQELGEMGFTVKQEGPITVGKTKTPAFQRIYTITAPDTQMGLMQWQVYVVVKGEAITFTSTDKAATFAKTMPIFQAAIGEFRFVEDK
jgi:hypothetical protein